MKRYWFLILFSLISIRLIAQFKSQIIDSAYNNYTKDYEEIVFTHINKTKYLTGEILGFTSYVIDKKTKKPSKITKNLFCTLSDRNDSIVASKLFKVDNGFVDGYFQINDSLKNGVYTFKSFTNWMRNFPQKNYHSEKIEVIGIENTYHSKRFKKGDKIDVQFLPESGHLIANTLNLVGVIAIDSLGFGVPNITGKIYDDQNNFVKSFQLNENGIGSFYFTPDSLKTYKAELNHQNKKTTLSLTEPIEKNGLILQLNRTYENAIISVVTNSTNYKTKNYKLTFHNGNYIQTLPIEFDDTNFVTKKIALKELPPGIVVFTLFDNENNPIAERLFFNYEHLTIINSTKSIINKQNDSTKVVLDFNQINLGTNNVSISILPSTTLAHQKNTNIISKIFLEPYIKYPIANADYYFTNIDKNKIKELDDLLITQGWSSYDWSSIFDEKKSKKFAFENGIDLKINIYKNNNKKKVAI